MPVPWMNRKREERRGGAGGGGEKEGREQKRIGWVEFQQTERGNAESGADSFANHASAPAPRITPGKPVPSCSQRWIRHGRDSGGVSVLCR